MPVFDTPIHANDQSWTRVVNQKQPILLYLFDHTDGQFDEELKRTARENAGQLLVVRIDARENPQIAAQYNHPDLPALFAFKDGAPLAEDSSAQASDVTPYAAFALNKGPKPAVAPKFQPNAAEGKLADAPITITDGLFPSEVLQSKIPVLLDFWAPWCGPCHMLAPTVEKIAKKYAGKIKVGKLNVDQNPRTAGQYQTMSIPTLILFHQGKVVGRLVGVQPQTNIEQLIDSTLRGH